MDKSYTIVINGKPEGPYSLSELKSKNINEYTFVRKPGMDDYKEAHEIAELSELFGLKSIKTAPQYYASFDQRLMAWAIDIFLISLVYVVLLFVGFVFVEAKETRFTMVAAVLCLITITNFVYGIFADASASQGTIGKKAIDIKVCNLYGNRITLSNSAGRTFAKIFSYLPLCLGIVYSLFNYKKQCLHDVITDTLVIKDRLI